MVKLYASLLAITLATSLALASSDKRQRVRHPSESYTHGIDSDYDLDGKFSGREYLWDASDLEARQPNFFRSVFGDVGKVAHAGLHAAKTIVKNPVVQTVAEAAIPGGAETKIAAKIAGNLGKVKKFSKAIDLAKKADKHLGGAKKVVGSAKKVHKLAKQVQQIASPQKSAHQTAQNRVSRFNPSKAKKVVLAFEQIMKKMGALKLHRHRRDLEDDEDSELLQRDLDEEELFEREYDDFLAERGYFDDLD